MWSTGSVTAQVLNAVENIPAHISGIVLTIANQQCLFVSNFPGVSTAINTAAITDAYQPAVTNLTIANVLRLMSTDDLGAGQVSIGDLTVNNDNLNEVAKGYEENAINDIKRITGQGIRYFKARG